MSVCPKNKKQKSDKLLVCPAVPRSASRAVALQGNESQLSLGGKAKKRYKGRGLNPRPFRCKRNVMTTTLPLLSINIHWEENLPKIRFFATITPLKGNHKLKKSFKTYRFESSKNRRTDGHHKATSTPKALLGRHWENMCNFTDIF